MSNNKNIHSQIKTPSLSHTPSPTQSLSHTPAPSSIYWDDIPVISKRYLALSSLLRILFSVIILFLTDLPPFIKVLLVILLDFIDCDPGHFFNFYNVKFFCRTELYQNTDKIFDLISYFLIFLYVFSNNFFSPQVNFIILFLFAYRILGMYLFKKNNDRKYLMFFPNFAPEIILVLLVFLAFPDFFKNTSTKVAFIILTIIYKIMNELAVHYNSNLINIKYRVEDELKDLNKEVKTEYKKEIN